MTTQLFAPPGFGLASKFKSIRPVPHLATSSADAGIDSLPMELTDLGAHADRCKRSQGALFALSCAADAVHGFIAPRVITTLVVSGILIGICSLII